MTEKDPNKKITKDPDKIGKSPVALREERILKFWQENKIFEKTLAKPSPKGNFVFYDGPPFATGLPHYGHILASAIKDAVPRYQTMKGKHVERRWGWDCHGLPIENIVEKDLKISGKKDIEKFGIEKFNEYARSKVLDFVHDWKKTVERIGRFVDFDGSYKTMDNTFIESVWWALKEIWNKGMIYEGTKVLPYCPRCETPIANSEISMDGSYRDISDISIYAKFKLNDEPKTFLLAWTTTPWTLPGNFALAVNLDSDYVKITISNGEKIILAKSRLAVVKESYSIGEEFKGKKLVGMEYIPPFDYFKKIDFPNKKNAWKVYGAGFVTTVDGTGIVHVAPGYGEDDMNLAKSEQIPFIHHVGTDGKFLPVVKDFAGIQVKPKDDHQSADILILKHLAHSSALFAKEKIMHSYPHCFRCETPLFYYAIPAWFMKIQDLKPKLLKLNEKISWIPGHLKEGRFKKSMEGAPDWNISRNRYWASPLPFWRCEKCRKVHVLGSLDDIKEKTTKNNKYILMRHGEAEQNVKNILSSKPNYPHHLTAKGEESARRRAFDLRDKKIDFIFSSPFVRTKETAFVIAKELGLTKERVIFDNRLGELNFGDLDGQSVSEYSKRYHYSYDERFLKPLPGGESLTDVKRRVGEFLYEVDSKYRDKNILIVSHETPLWMAVAVAKGADVKETITLRSSKEDFIKTGEIIATKFSVIPHNSNFELDFHRPYIDEISWACSCGGMMRRISEVVDCWFESGSMPFAQNHYPFEKKDWFLENFPAQFVAEYIAQTRTWFYYTHVLSTTLFKNIPFENVVTTGTILAEDGQKMSKSRGNFPDPWILFNRYGVDALRFYLLSSPLMKSEDVNFNEKGVDEVYKKLIMRLDNVYAFYDLYKGETLESHSDSKNVLDRWICALLSSLASQVEMAMDNYEIDQALLPVNDFVDDLSTWYIRRSRDRFKNSGAEDMESAISTTRFVLLEFSKIIAPFMPFIAEDIYQKVRSTEGKESVHLETWPDSGKQSFLGKVFGGGNSENEKVIANMEITRQVVSRALEARAKANIKVRQPLLSLHLKEKLPEEYLALIRDEINVKEVIYDPKINDISLDTTITRELREEGMARELIRFIQDLRKESHLNPKDIISLEIGVDSLGKTIVKKFDEHIKKSTMAKEIKFVAVSGGALNIDSVNFSVKILR